MTKTVNFQGEELTPVIGQYANGQTSIRLIDQNGEEFLTASVAHDITIGTDQVIIKNYSENERILEALVRSGIIEKPFMTIPVNFVTLYVSTLI